ncbi:MAG: glycosyltransferase [Anaerolineae bacterium]|nr:glycosyltransferase [Anaerolineae bacterium]
MIILQIMYCISALGLALIGLNTLVLSALYLRYRKDRNPRPAVECEADWPPVVVQLPIYNERHVIVRLVEAINKLDYPRDRLLVQILDDSTDDTVEFAAVAAEHACAEGLQIEHIHREDREGYKAGALNVGLNRTEAPFVAIFDADFTPGPDFLRKVIPYFLENKNLGMVQTRWAHLNTEESPLTHAQALALDAHFVVEQTARHRSGLLMNFSGTAGIWRRECIESGGGWQSGTLSEDIDLSYRAQLKGWEFLYLPDVSAPAEIPPLMMAFKRQQSRWATGTVQCLRKLGGRLIRSRLTAWQKLQGIIHLGGYFLHPLMILLLLLTLPLLLMDGLNNLPLAGLGLAMLGSPVQAIISQSTLYPDWKKRLLYFPLFMVMGAGIAVSNSAAVYRGFRNQTFAFRRTPKFHAQGQGSSWTHSSYTLPVDWTTTIEIGLAVYALVIGALAVTRLPALVPFMMLYAAGFAYTAGLSLWQARVARKNRRAGNRTLGLSPSSR